MLTNKDDINAVLHVHSVWGTLLSEKYGPTGGFWLEGYEMLKGLSGIKSHESRIWIDIYPNSQDITELAKKVNERTFGHKEFVPFGFLIRKHGLYAWGANLEEAQRHVETLEFLFEVTGRTLLIKD
jgi:methylthioribulose-1-phosphate dehydratase